MLLSGKNSSLLTPHDCSVFCLHYRGGFNYSEGVKLILLIKQKGLHGDFASFIPILMHLF